MRNNLLSRFYLMRILLILFFCFFCSRGGLMAKEHNTPLNIAISDLEIVQKGNIIGITFNIHNISSDFIILMFLEPESNRNEDGYTWQESVYGSIDYDSENDNYNMNPLAQMATPAILNNGLLAPNEITSVSLRLYAMQEEHQVQLKYYYLNITQAQKYLYFPENESENVWGNSSFKRISIEKLANLRENRENEIFSQSYIIIFDPPAELDLQSQSIDVSLELEEPPFTYSMALEVLDTDEHNADAYYTPTSSWILHKEEKLYLVDEDNIIPLPNMSIKVFYLMDSFQEGDKVEVSFSEDAYNKLKDLYNITELNDMYHNGYFTTLGRDEFLPLLQDAYAHQLSVNVHYYFFSSWRLNVE